MLTFVTFFWREPGFHTTYTDEHVRRWSAMVDKHYRKPHRRVVVTSVVGDYGDTAVVADDNPWAALRSPEGGGFPTCYRRLRVWGRDAAQVFGDRIVVMDLDCAVVADLAPVVDRPEPVVMLRDAVFPTQYNGGMMLLTAGARPDVLERFDGLASIEAAKRAGFRGSDQAWISYALGPNLPTLAGVHSWKRDLKRGLPTPETRVVMFHGRDKPWHSAVPVLYR